MTKPTQWIVALGFLMLPHTTANAGEIRCIHPERPNHTYSIADGEGVYTWDDHEIERSWALECNTLTDGATTCHRSESFGGRGRSVMVFRMLPDGSLIESAYWALLNTSRVTVTPGFICTDHGE